MGNLLNKAVQGLAGGVGLVSEGVSVYSANQRAKKSPSVTASAVQDSSSSPSDYSDNKRNIEETAWELDEAQDELVGGSSSKEQREESNDVTVLADKFLTNHPPPYQEFDVKEPLGCSVILPQRRPKDRSRGFVRAYAPVLESRGIDQAMFIDFIETFNSASKASPWINAINLAQIGTFFVPSVTGLIVGMVIHQATIIAKEGHARHQTNKFLTKVNDDFFRPRGLYCLVMTWAPDSSQTEMTVNLSTSQISPPSSTVNLSGPREIARNFRASDGKTYGDLQFPEAATLIYPGLDTLASRNDEKATKMKKSADFVSDYLDRRARARFALENPQNQLAAGPQANFTSRFADPSHPSNSGSLFALLSGGVINPDRFDRQGSHGSRDHSRSRDRRAGLGSLVGGIQEMRASALEPRSADMSRSYDDRLRGWGRRGRGTSPLEGLVGGLSDMISGQGNRLEVQGNGQRGGRSFSRGDGPIGNLDLGGSVKKMLSSNVYYLMIVDMPSDEDMAAAKRAMDEMYVAQDQNA